MDPLDPGTHVNIQFSLPNNHLIRTRGEVIWSDLEGVEPGMGVKFLGLSFEDRESILNCLKKLAIL